MQTVYSSDGCDVVATHRPSGESRVTGRATNPADAARAADIINRGMRLNEDRKYTASARMYARLDAIAGFVDFDA